MLLQHCLWGRGQRGNSAAFLLVSSPLSNKLSCETGSFSHRGNHSSPQSTLNLSFTFSQPCSCGPLPCSGFSEPALPTWPCPRFLLVWCFCMIFFFNSLVVRVPCSSILWCFWLLIDFRVVFSFWLCEEAKGFYLCLHLGQNSNLYYLKCKDCSKKLQSCK